MIVNLLREEKDLLPFQTMPVRTAASPWRVDAPDVLIQQSLWRLAPPVRASGSQLKADPASLFRMETSPFWMGLFLPAGGITSAGMEFPGCTLTR